ncbi:hypothetical protein [Lignipirellula cremea]|uniref:DUF1559 domain-containing protein n=1 Tax=Lignipirellula cremea TaxID=2528010 RepID=A0A518E4Q7_9BACT|nr:hypothetical protein [Lignipirellula cremea]QDU99066.1 hypothetical protein Pla8534_69770 [Lignipirellula cremea]
MQDLLLGYLLGALEPHEHKLVEQRLAEDPALLDQLHRLAEQIFPLGDAAEDWDPPAGLSQRTCDLVDAFCDDFPAPTSTPVPAFAGPPESADPPPGPPPRIEPAAPRNSYRSWADLTVTAGVVAAAAMLFFPSIVTSWYESRKLACQDNLLQIGRALVEYSTAHHECFPALATEGQISVAGVYGPTLLESGVLQSPRSLICPDSALATDNSWRVPTLQDLKQSSGQQLASLQKASGGSYGYTLGHVSDGFYQPTRNQARTYFAIMSDAPSSRTANHQSENHGGRGQNVLYEDLHIRFVRSMETASQDDDFFANRHGVIAAGADENDVVIGASDAIPVLQNALLPALRP